MRAAFGSWRSLRQEESTDGNGGHKTGVHRRRLPLMSTATATLTRANSKNYLAGLQPPPPSVPTVTDKCVQSVCVSSLCSLFWADHPQVKCHLHSHSVRLQLSSFQTDHAKKQMSLRRLLQTRAPFRNPRTSPSPKLAPQGHLPSPPPPAGGSSLAYLYWGKYFTLYELLSVGPVLSSVEIDQLFTALLGQMRRKPGPLSYQIVCHER